MSWPCIDRGMSILHHLLNKVRATGNIREVSEYFPITAINRLFDQEIERLDDDTADPTGRQSLKRLREIDIVRYVDRSLRRVGVPTHDLDEHVQQVLIKLLLGGLFRGWDKQSPIDARFRVSVSNAAKTVAKRYHRQRQRTVELPRDVEGRVDAEEPDEAVIERFRALLRSSLGDAAVGVLDHRMKGGETKELIGNPGTETSYRLKLVVRNIKNAARRFAANEPDLAALVGRVFSQEEAPMTRGYGAGG